LRDGVDLIWIAKKKGGMGGKDNRRATSKSWRKVCVRLLNEGKEPDSIISKARAEKERALSGKKTTRSGDHTRQEYSMNRERRRKSGSANSENNSPT